MPILIGISGKKHTGKTSVANIVIRITGNSNPIRYAKWDQCSFGTAVKEICSYITSDERSTYNSETKKYEKAKGLSITRREFMQKLGTDVARAIDKDIWIKYLANNIFDDKGKLVRNVIIDDVRFKNEADFIVENGGLLIRLEGNPGEIDEVVGTEHSSENELDDYPFKYVLNTNDIGTPRFISAISDILTTYKVI